MWTDKKIMIALSFLLPGPVISALLGNLGEHWENGVFLLDTGLVHFLKEYFWGPGVSLASSLNLLPDVKKGFGNMLGEKLHLKSFGEYEAGPGRFWNNQ